MLILEQARKKFQTPAQMDAYVLGSLALGVSIPFGILSAQFLKTWLGGQSWLIGLVLGSSLFSYTILLAQLLKRQPPLFLKRLFPRKDIYRPRSIGEISGLRLDYVGNKDPQDSVDGIVHTRNGELQRMLRCTLPQRLSFSGQSVLLEMLFADLALFSNTRFQIIFPEADNGRRKEMVLIASHMITRSAQCPKEDKPPLAQMQELLDRLLERLITLGISPKVMNAFEVRQLISEELGSSGTKSQLNRDWRSVGNLGWEPSFRDILLKPNERYMQVANRRSFTFTVEQLPSNGSFEWLPAVLADIPHAHVSLFISPWTAADPISKLRMTQQLKKYSGEINNKDAIVNPAAAKMSFFFRFDGHDAYQLESEVSTARKYLSSLGLSSSFHTQRQQQLQNWRSTLPCAPEQMNNKHIIAFMRSK